MNGNDYDAIVIGAGHNGLVCAAYLAKSGMRTLLVEARHGVGGTAASESFAGATVNICNCDHVTFRTTPIMEELGLAELGLRYLEVEPSQFNLTWSGGPAWASHHDIEQTIDSIARSHPSEVDGYRRYLKTALPAVKLVFDAANEPPSVGGLTRKLVEHRGRGAATLLRWSRRTAADVMREYFRTDALQAPALLVGPMVWGISPETPGSGLAGLTYAMRHVGRLGRPVGGSGQLPATLQKAFERAGGTLRTDTKVSAITCEGPAVRGVTLDDGTEITAPVVVSACNPHDTFLHWLKNPPPQAHGLVERWRNIPHADGYELMQVGKVLNRPGLLANVPSVTDPTLAPEGRHVLSLETLFTPYAHPGGWATSPEPSRWLDLFGQLAQPGFRESVVEWRAMTPDRYEREFHLPHGHATSFAGGPLAALHNANPELTNYETDVQGLYLTGAATFPGAGVWGASGRNAALTVLRRAG